jgi:hypothetical protein
MGLTYAAIVWKPRVKFKTSKVQLSKLPRMACLDITGAMKTAVVVVLIGLPTTALAVGG